MRPIRSLRIKKKSYRSLRKRFCIIGIQWLAIIFLLFCITLQITSPTTAFFNDIDTYEGSISAADDFGYKPKIKRISEGGNCDKIYAVFKNEGKGDAELLKYELLSKKQGNKQVVKSGKVSIEAGNTKKLHFNPDKNGKYRFKIYKESGNNGRSIVQSHQIKVGDCKDDKAHKNKDETANDKAPANNEKTANDKNQKNKDKAQTNSNKENNKSSKDESNAKGNHHQNEQDKKGQNHNKDIETDEQTSQNDDRQSEQQSKNASEGENKPKKETNEKKSNNTKRESKSSSQTKTSLEEEANTKDANNKDVKNQHETTKSKETSQ